MFQAVEVPLWLVVLTLLLAAVAALDRVLAPSMRWFLRGRMERAVARLNQRLQRPIEPFKLMRRQDMIVRLIYDPKVSEAIADHARETGVPRSVAFEEAHRYAREIVPGFSTTLYFGFAIRIARMLSRALYRVRVGPVDEAAMAAIDPQATVIFVMNHRSNMDYVLVTWLAAERSALSYAVGEWARVWPLSRLIRAMGAYFIRRKSRNPLYRRVLARYVQIATAEGVTQAIFPEGGLSLDGRVGAARMGLLHYIVSGFEPGQGRDVVFIPVALSYDRVLEDRLLVEAAAVGERRFRARPMSILRFIGRYLWRRLRGADRRFGNAAVSFGAPVSLGQFMKAGGQSTETLAAHLMAEIGRVVTVLPVPLAAAALGAGGTRAEIAARAADLLGRLRSRGAEIALPDDSAEAGVRMGLASLAEFGLIRATGDRCDPVPSEAAMLAFYAAPVAQLLDAVAA